MRLWTLNDGTHFNGNVLNWSINTKRIYNWGISTLKMLGWILPLLIEYLGQLSLKEMFKLLLIGLGMLLLLIWLFAPGWIKVLRPTFKALSKASTHLNWRNFIELFNYWKDLVFAFVHEVLKNWVLTITKASRFLLDGMLNNFFIVATGGWVI